MPSAMFGTLLYAVIGAAAHLLLGGKRLVIV
jgi:hypothetical protein